MMDEIKMIKKNIVELIRENDRLKDEICQISTKFQDLNVKGLVEKNKQGDKIKKLKWKTPQVIEKMPVKN